MSFTARGIKVIDIAYIRLRSPDLDRMEQFLTDFGLMKSARTANALYMRGTDPVHHIHITELGEPRFVGLAFWAADEADLERAAKLPGASGIEHLDEPGGGRRVRLKEPNGYQIEIVHGIEAVPPVEIHRLPMNSAAEPLKRKGELMRHRERPTPVKRIAHGVISSPRVVETVRWFRQNLGFICSDDVYVGDESNIIGSFNRCDRGEEYVDHHAFACMNAGPDKVGLHHVSFEAQDVEALFADHHYLKSLNRYEHMWGIGRHIAGSQMFDYWADPWGRMHERWADSDRLNAASGSYLSTPPEALASQWGPDAPPKVMTHASP